MQDAVQIAWRKVPEAVQKLRTHFKDNPQGCLAYARVANSIDHAQMAAIACSALQSLHQTIESNALASSVCGRALELADIKRRNNDTQGELDTLKAAHLAAEHVPELVDRCSAHLDSLIEEEIGRDPLDPSQLAGFLTLDHVALPRLFEGFQVLARNGAHQPAAIIADQIRKKSGTTLHKELFSALRQQSIDLLRSRDPQTSGAYFVVLNRMAPENASVAAIRPKIIRALSEVLAETLKSMTDLPRISALAALMTTLDNAHPAGLRASAFIACHDGDVDTCTKLLDAMNRVAPREWKWVLVEARRALHADALNVAVALFRWLKRAGYVESEADKSLVSVSRRRLQDLRIMTKNGNESALKAAEAVLDLVPANTRALWIGGRALARMRKPEMASPLLRRLLDIEPEHASAHSLLASCEKLLSVDVAA